MSPRSLREYQFSDFALRPDCLSLRYRGEERRLPPKSFAALLYLLENRGRVVPKEELIDRVWEHTAVSDDVLVGCIGEIRKALDDSAERQIIRTFPKAGYQFVAAVVEVERPASDPAPTAPQPAPRRRPWLLPLGVVACLAPAAWLVWWFWPVQVHEVGWWRFEGTSDVVADSSGRDNPGRIHAEVRRIAEGPAGHALRFSGKGWVTGDSAGSGFPQKNGSFTITAWVRLRPGDTFGPVFHFGSARSQPRSNAHLFVAGSGVACFGWGYGHESACGTRSLADGEWHHLAGRYDSTTSMLLLYVDAEEYARRLSGGPADIGHGTPWMIGSYQTGGSPFSGDLADVRLYDGALTHPQIDAQRECTLSNLASLPGGGQAYAVPLYRATVERRPTPQGEGPELSYSGFGNGGIEFGYSEGACSLASLEGVALQEDLRIGMDILLPPQTEGGPFFHARRVTPGDPIEAPGSGGVWVRLRADGKITVEALAHREDTPVEPLATGFAARPANPSGWRHLEAEMRGGQLRVWVDGAAVRLSVPGSAAKEVVPIATKTETAAGIAVKAPAHPTDAILLRNITVRDPAR